MLQCSAAQKKHSIDNIDVQWLKTITTANDSSRYTLIATTKLNDAWVAEEVKGRLSISPTNGNLYLDRLREADTGMYVCINKTARKRNLTVLGEYRIYITPTYVHSIHFYLYCSKYIVSTVLFDKEYRRYMIRVTEFSLNILCSVE